MESDRKMSNNKKRYTLVLPEALYDEVEKIAQDEETTVIEIIRRFIKLGLLAMELQASPSGALIIREGDKEREIFIL